MIIMVIISVKMGDIGEIGPNKSYLDAPGDGDDDEIVPPKKLLSLGGGCLPHSSSSSTVGYNCLVIWKTNQHMCVLLI